MQTRQRLIDLNCDMGESFGAYQIGADADLMPLITSANIACGFHAGDPAVMSRTVKLAVANGVSLGAHPGLPDLAGFGRRGMQLSPDEIETTVLYQVGALQAFATAHRTTLTHVKPHGALYNMAAKDAVVARAIADAVAAFDQGLILICLANSVAVRVAIERGLKVAQEVFADRGYQADGALVPRGREGAIIGNVEVVAARAVRLVLRGEVETVDGTLIQLCPDTICLHGDTAGAVSLARALRDAFRANGVQLAPLRRSEPDFTHE